MVEINIFSDDILFAKMLVSELRYSFGYQNEMFSFALNPSSPRAHPSVCIVDLDSKYADSSFTHQHVIGFSSSTETATSKKYFFCKEIFIRPFLLKDFTLLISEISRELLD